MKYCNNFEELNLLVLEKLKSKNLIAKNIEESENKFLIEKQNLNIVLKTIFKKCSKNSYCFTIYRDEFELVKVDIYDKDMETQNRVYIYLCEPSLINEIDKKNYLKIVEKYKKLKIFPVIGPDGVGKTTLLTNSIDINEKEFLYKRFKKIVRRSFLYNLTYPITKTILKRKLKEKPLKDQHDDIYYSLAILSGLFYYPYLVYNTYLRKKVVFIDRFFNDYLLENISFLDKKTKIRTNWKKILNYIPKVYWKIHLDAKAKTILLRKDELTKRDIKKYRNLNFKIYLEKPSIIYTYINTQQALENCKNVLLSTAINAKVLKEESNCHKYN
ncbi:hypothetical protein AMYT_1957 [Malaciobacter mytili LMG 24559]|nr:hypothetical protein [Malaciobacter mytili]AXH15525.1 hypothetical protein AMYT_1957 [Malaciobacter mytili LMG 24559]